MDTHRLFACRISLPVAAVIIFSFFSSSSAFTKTYIIQFGGIHGYTYYPNTLNVFVGDTIKWAGDFHTLSLESTSLPTGVPAFGPVISGDTFMYIPRIVGDYNYGNSIYSPIGMTGSFSATFQRFGLSNEGREFYLGMLYPSYNHIEPLELFVHFHAAALISTYYKTEITVSYFDAVGNEGSISKFEILPGFSYEFPLDPIAMTMDTASDALAFRSCHIKSTQPVSVTYISGGPCAGGSYLALPVLGLGKNYVAASYNDNPGLGAFYGGFNNPSTFEYSAGEFEIIATEGQTIVKITPTTTTITGHPGASTGVPHPYTVTLQRGQCYLVRSTAKSDENDMSGSLIESSKPIAVISGHENAFLGGTDPYVMEGRDFMIEQMLPVEYWDSTGYISLPFVESNPPGTEGAGDSYRIYTFDTGSVNVHLNVQGFSGGYDYSTRRLVTPPSKSEVQASAEAYSTNGKKIFLMQYDERSVTPNAPWPAPSMMSIIPVSRWKRSYSLYTFLNKQTKDYRYMNVLTPSISGISVSTNGGIAVPLSTLTHVGSFAGISSQFPLLKGEQFMLPADMARSYHLFSDNPFMVYFYGMSDAATDGLGSITAESSSQQHISEYAAPVGTQLNTGVTPLFAVETQPTCSGWHVCIRDTGNTDPGIKAVILIDDPDGIYWQIPAKYSNVNFDSTATDYADGELHPHWHTNSAYCFDVNFVSPLAAASAPLAIVDNLGNAIILRLDRTAPTVKLATNPQTSTRADSIVFPVKQIGTQICTTFVLKNTAPKNGTAINLNSVSLSNSNTSYKSSTDITFPHSIAAGDSVSFQVCYTPIDSSRHQDTLILKSDCFSIPISLDAHGSTGLISAGDLDFKTVYVGDTSCKVFQIKNVGSAPFTLTSSYLNSDTLNFTVNSKLPVTINPGGYANITICFHPQAVQNYSDSIIWNTDLESAFKHSLKDHSLLSGEGIQKAGVKSSTQENIFTIRPNPANGNSVIVTFDGWTEVHPTMVVFDVLGREVYKKEIASGASQIQIPIQSLPEGTYYVRLNSENGSITQNFMKVK